MVGVDDDVHTSNSSELEFASFNASHGQFLPGLRSVGLLSSFNGSLELFEADETRCNLSVVLNLNEQKLSSFE